MSSKKGMGGSVGEQVEDVEDKVEDIEKEVEELEEVEDLSDVDIGLDTESLLYIASQERFRMAVGYQRLTLQKNGFEMSRKANRSAGNNKGAEQLTARLDEVDLNAKNMLRTIKEIDKDYPKAKKRMQEMASKRSQEALLGS